MATIIKPASGEQQRPATAVQPVAFHFDEMEGQASDYLQMIRDEAGKIVQEAHQEADRIRKEAEKAGRATAQAAIEQLLEERVARQISTLRPAIERLVSELRDARADWQRHWEQAAVRLATQIASRIIHRELREDPRIPLEILSEALKLASTSAEIVVQMNPGDVQSLGKEAEALAHGLCGLAPSQVMADEAIAPGGCRVKTKFGTIDMGIEAQLRRIEEELA